MKLALPPQIIAAAIGVLGIVHPSVAGERQLASFKGMAAFVSDAADWCRETVDITVRSAKPEDFSADKTSLQRLLGALRAILGDECPKVSKINLSGRTGNTEIYRGIASKDTDWILVDAAVKAATAAAPPASAAPASPPQPATASERVPPSVSTTPRSAAPVTGGNIVEKIIGSVTGLGLEKRCESFLQWSKRLEQEYPGIDFQREPMNKLQVRAYSLFADENFVPFFGKPYDAMSEGERKAVATNTIRPCQQEAKYRRGWEWVLLFQPFGGVPQAQFAFVQVSQEVVQGREVRTNLSRLKQEAENLPATVQGYERLAVIWNDTNAFISVLFPSEQDAIRTAVSSQKMRLAEGALGEKLKPLLAAAPSYDAAMSLKRAMEDQSHLVKEVAPATRLGYEKQIQERLNAVISHLVQEEKKKIAQFGNNLAGLQDGEAWYQQFEKRYVGELKDASAPAIQKSYLEQRRAQIAGASPELAGMVKKAASAGDIDQIIARAFTLPGDKDDAATKPVFAAADARKVQLCDEGGAHPDDPEAVSAGVANDKIDTTSLIAACEGAVKIDGKTPRLRFQLARGLLLIDLFEPAVEQLVAAAEEGHGASLAYLADLHLQGAPGIEADPALAQSLYQQAVASGFAPAQAILNEFQDRTEEFTQAEKEEKEHLAQQAEQGDTTGGTAEEEPLPPDQPLGFTSEGYHFPDVMTAIYSGDLARVPDDIEMRRYVVSIAKQFNGYCGEEIEMGQAALEYVSPKMGQAMRGGAADISRLGWQHLIDMLKMSVEARDQVLSGGGMPDLSRYSLESKILRQEGINDGNLFLARYACHDSDARQFRANMNEIFRERRSVPAAKK